MLSRTTTRLCAVAVAGLSLSALSLGRPSASATPHSEPQPASYALQGDPEGSKFEGIGVSPDARWFYVSEVTGGEIHRGKVGGGPTPGNATEWKPAGADDRGTARGITTDDEGRVYVAGGPNGIGTAPAPVNNGRPDLWVYSETGELLAALRTGVDNAFLNDVAIGPDGAAYFTNSNAAQIFRVSQYQHGDRKDEWKARLWADATDRIATTTGFNLGGIVVSEDAESLIVAQGNVGRLWRFRLSDGKVDRIRTSADVTNADGLVRKGDRLLVVRNFSRVLTTLRLKDDDRRAKLVSEVPSDADRFFTTAKLAAGRLLLVDSKFDEQTAAPPYEIVVRRWPKR